MAMPWEENWDSVPQSQQPTQQPTQAQGGTLGVSPELLTAVSWEESRFNPTIVSPAGAIGAYQFMPATAKHYGIDPTNPTQSRAAAEKYLRSLEKRFGSTELALTAYNWGEGNVEAWLKTGKGAKGQNMPLETQRYADKVLSALENRPWEARGKKPVGLTQTAQATVPMRATAEKGSVAPWEMDWGGNEEATPTAAQPSSMTPEQQAQTQAAVGFLTPKTDKAAQLTPTLSALEQIPAETTGKPYEKFTQQQNLEAVDKSFAAMQYTAFPSLTESQQKEAMALPVEKQREYIRGIYDKGDNLSKYPPEDILTEAEKADPMYDQWKRSQSPLAQKAQELSVMQLLQLGIPANASRALERQVKGRLVQDQLEATKSDPIAQGYWQAEANRMVAPEGYRLASPREQMLSPAQQYYKKEPELGYTDTLRQTAKQMVQRPGETAVGLAQGLVSDFYLLGLGAAAGPLKAAAIGGGSMAAGSVAEQLSHKDSVNWSDVQAQATIGAATGGVLSAVHQLRAKEQPVAHIPLTPEQRGNFRAESSAMLQLQKQLGDVQPETVVHSQHVASLAVRLAKELDLDPVTQSRAALVSQTHDLGKIVIPRELLNKQGPLTPQERALLNTHASESARILKNAGFPDDLVQAVGQHHGQVNGQYPQFVAEVARVADVAASVGFKDPAHPYVADAGLNKALSILSDSSKFNPEVVGAFKRLVHDGRLPSVFENSMMNYRGNLNITRGQQYALAAAGLTAAGIASLDSEQREAFFGTALAGGLLLSTHGKVDYNFIKPELAKTLGGQLVRSDYGLRTFERLPLHKESFTKQEIQQVLNMSDIPQAEKTLVKGIMDSSTTERMTAEELITGMKVRTNTIKLKPEQTHEYANYGMERLNIPYEYADDGVKFSAPATTRMWKSAETLDPSASNHFQSPNLFGWTRSFERNGVRHVTELQSDLAQRGTYVPPKSLEIDTLKNLVRSRKMVLDSYETARDFYTGNDAKVIADRKASIVDAKKSYNDARARYAEALKKPEMDDYVPPLLKNYERRLVQEELNSARQNGENVVRFPTADTVAKVEGWPVGENGKLLYPETQGIYNRYAKETTNYLKSLGGKEVKDDLGNSWIETPVPQGLPARQFGKVDKSLVAAMGSGALAFLAAKGILDDDQTITQSLIGLAGAVIPLAFSKMGRRDLHTVVDKIDYGLGAVSTRVRNVDEALRLRMMKYEKDSLVGAFESSKSVEPFAKARAALPENVKTKLDAIILTNDPKLTETALRQLKDQKLAASYENVIKTVGELGKTMKDLGILENLREEHFPRVVTDHKGLLEALGSQDRQKLQQMLEDADAKSRARTGDVLDEVGRSRIINNYINGRIPGDGKPGFARQRVLQEVSEKLLPFYASPEVGLGMYIRHAVAAIEKARFFGKHAVTESTGYGRMIDVDASMNAMLAEKLRTKKITYDQATEVASIIKSRFGAGDQSSHWIIQDARNLAYTGLLGNFVSAATQFGDLMILPALHGITPTLSGLVKTLTGRSEYKMKDIGLSEHIAEEFTNQRTTAKFMNKAFKYGGFSYVDMFSKNVSMQTIIDSARKSLRSESGQKKFYNENAMAWEGDTVQLMNDLASGQKTELTDLYVFSKLSDIQPISRMEVPQAYLDNPNGRLFYMLHTYQLKQLDIVRRNAYNSIKQGNVGNGIRKLTEIGAMLAVSGATIQEIKDWMMGQESETTLATALWNIPKTFGWSQYVLDKVKKGQPLQAILGTAIPPVQMFDQILNQDPRAWNFLPVIGRFIYATTENAANRATKREQKKMNQELEPWRE